MTVKEPTIKELQTTTAGWQNLCLELARSAVEFSIENVAVKHLIFIDALAAAYHYETLKVQRKVTFLRKESLLRNLLLATPTLEQGVRSQTRACRRENPVPASLRACRREGAVPQTIVSVCGG